MVPLVTIALSVFVSLRLIALLTHVPGLGFQVINITRVFIVVVLFGAGTDYCLFLIARYCEELGRGRLEDRRTSGGDPPGRYGVGRQRRHGDRRPWHALFLEFRQGQIHGADDRTELDRGSSGRADPGSRDVGRASWGHFLAVPCPAKGGRRRCAGSRDSEAGLLAGFWARVADLVVTYPALDPLGLPAGARALGRGRGSNQVEPQPVERPRPGSSQRHGSERGQTILRRRRAESGGRAGRQSAPEFPIPARAARRSTRSIAACKRSRTSPKFARLPNLSAMQPARPRRSGCSIAWPARP